MKIIHPVAKYVVDLKVIKTITNRPENWYKSYEILDTDKEQYMITRPNKTLSVTIINLAVILGVIISYLNIQVMNELCNDPCYMLLIYLITTTVCDQGLCRSYCSLESNTLLW